MRRDPKGLYQKALQGKVKRITGISDVYEEPIDSDQIIDTELYDPKTSTSMLNEFVNSQFKSKS